MQIKNHLLIKDDGNPVSFKATPNKGGRLVPQYLVMHYTAATTANSAISWFQSSNAQASAHLLIDRDGSITQFAPFNIVTWHAGKSQWKGLTGLNQFSIGIELVNGGRLAKSGSKWICPVDHKTIPADEVIIARHKNDNFESGWQEYTEKQLEAAMQIGALLVKTYALKDVVGHEDIAPIRKSDPGPAFPMSSYRSKVMGRKGTDLEEVKNSVELNIRAGAGSNFQTLTQALPVGTNMLILRSEGTWSFVEVLNPVHGIMDLEGWVSTKYLVPA